MAPSAFWYGERDNCGEYGGESRKNMDDKGKEDVEWDAKDEHSFFPPDSIKRVCFTERAIAISEGHPAHVKYFQKRIGRWSLSLRHFCISVESIAAELAGEKCDLS